ncbi:MAG TPA: Rieske 2Fe-2S domain-containing protein [Chloroflexota bacterium]|nr:Rieske 2Fe-2S domain-containing protein [Chloroflexota bacterium]
MLTAEENRLLTQVGPGTPGGELLRRYWHPVAFVSDVCSDSPAKYIRMLGEDLVLFLDKSGRVGLLADHCSHRGASLLYGRVEERGIACAYHGWLFDTRGNCLETPAEPPDSKFYLTVKHRAYPVVERYGMYWTYMGPAPAPVLQRYDVTERGVISSIRRLESLDCNWLQTMENHVDQTHTVILHQATRQRGVDGMNTARGLIDQLASTDYTETAFGISRHRVDADGYDDSDLLIFPTCQRIYNILNFKVPIDDTHTRRFSFLIDLGLGNASPTDARAAAGRDPSGRIRYADETVGKTPANARHPFATYRMDQLLYQDNTVLETQGAISDRTVERLATADKGVVLLRKLLRREIDKVQHGEDPIGVIRDPMNELIDTNIQVYIDAVQKVPAPVSAVSVAPQPR